MQFQGNPLWNQNQAKYKLASKLQDEFPRLTRGQALRMTTHGIQQGREMAKAHFDQVEREAQKILSRKKI